jgi:uncharacterized membrane protein
MSDPVPAPQAAAAPTAIGGPRPELVQYTHWIYALHSLSVLLGILGTATIVTMFVFGLPSIIAVIMNYARRSDTAGSYLESHFRWQIRTFWFALLWGAVTSIISAPLLLAFGFGIVTWAIGFTLVGLWVVYRVARGWLALRDGRAVPAPLPAAGAPAP